MSNLATSLLDFILDLLRDPEAAAEFRADPQGALEDAGLGDLCATDVDAILPMLADFAPVGSGGSSPARWAEDDDQVAGARRPDSGARPDHAPDHDGYLAIEHIKHIQNHYTYSPTTTIDASHSVWGDSYKIWAEDDAVVAVNGAIAAGDDVEDAEIDNSIRDSYNEFDVTGTGNAVGRDNDVEDVGNTDIDVDLENVGNSQHGTGNVMGDDNEVDNSKVEVDVEDVNLAFGENAVAGAEDVNIVNESLGVAQDVEIEDNVIAETAAVDSENVVQNSEYVAQDSELEAEVDDSLIVSDIELGLILPFDAPADAVLP